MPEFSLIFLLVELCHDFCYDYTMIFSRQNKKKVERIFAVISVLVILSMILFTAASLI
jgi:hypothetical protein